MAKTEGPSPPEAVTKPAAPERVAAFRTGLSAESRAAAFLMAKGYRILARRFRTPYGEIDLVAKKRNLVAFIDMAYQGFADGIEQDAAAPRLFGSSGLSFLLATSFSKSFSLYGERVGALSVATESSEEAARVLSQLKRVVRANYSNPPTFGAKAVATVLAAPELRELWDKELGHMRDRIKAMRRALVEKVHARAPGFDFSFVMRQRGLFSYSGLSKQQVRRLRDEFSIYAIDTGRLCVAALNSKNVDSVADAIAKVIR